MAEDPRLSPDGRRVAWVRRWMDPRTDRYRSAIVVTDMASGVSQQVTPGDALDTTPRWAPDGRTLAYLSTIPPCTSQEDPGGPPTSAMTVMRRGAQLWAVGAEGGKPRRLTWLPGGVHSPSWSPDGSRLAFVTYVPAIETSSAVSLKDLFVRFTHDVAADPFIRFNRDVVVTTRLRWKADGVGYVGDCYRHVAVLPFTGLEVEPLPEPELLTWGRFDLLEPSWAPDGRTLAAVGNLRPDGEAVRRLFVYLLDADAPRPVSPREVAGLEEMRSVAPAWSPDGKYVVVTGHDDPVIGHYGNQRVWLIGVRDGSKHCLTAALDRTTGDHSRNADLRDVQSVGDGPRWLPDGSGLLILVNQGGTVHLHRLALTGETVALTEGECVVASFSLDAAGRTAVLHVSDELNPGDLYALDLTAPAPAPLRRLTAVNAAVLSEVDLARPQRFRFRSDDVEVDAWIVPPPQRAPGRRYPLILYAGGGPGGMRACVFVHEFQVLAAAGYAVVYCNARGNQGYGEAFSTAIRGRWGDLDYADNMACVRAALAQFDYLDSDRLGVAGGSYGGYLVVWIIARHREFRAAVADRSLVNRLSQYGTSDIGYLLDRVEFEGRTPWSDPETYLDRSPLRYVGGVRTPTLVLHSGQDHRCAVEQGEQLYMALRRLGVPTELILFLTEGHDLSRSGRPWHRIFRLERYLDWFRRWL
jgi:dipeptidyl aminopeptidase/acylaminoacyl peptidase